MLDRGFLRILHCYFTVSGVTMHECKATCKDSFQDKNCVCLGGYRRVGIAAGMYISNVAPTKYMFTA